jgi:hypothetical protein
MTPVNAQNVGPFDTWTIYSIEQGIYIIESLY